MLLRQRNTYYALVWPVLSSGEPVARHIAVFSCNVNHKTKFVTVSVYWVAYVHCIAPGSSGVKAAIAYVKPAHAAVAVRREVEKVSVRADEWGDLIVRGVYFRAQNLYSVKAEGAVLIIENIALENIFVTLG